MVDSTLIFIVIGVILCLMEFVFPTAFITFMMGLAAFAVAIVSLFLPHYTLLMVLWLIFATGLTFLSRRFFTPKRKITITGDDLEAKVITGIPAGTIGRVLYEGNSWQAKCADETIDIAPNEPVYVVQKQGNTLIILPRKLLDQS